ncbi:MAG: amino acid permease, partial [Alphaproteobacteria bacterium]|nr:amino acid permease [Alphaproteobacteria bacterium]
MANVTTELKRTLTLPLVVLYGLGVTIGAGIYVLLGATAGAAGVYAPVSFVLAALVMLPSACSFAELVGRLPFSAGEAAYVRQGFDSQALSIVVGLMVVAVGTVSASAICLGSIGYIREFVDLPTGILLPIVVALMTTIAAWGVRESVTFAGVMTTIEILGLLVIVAAGGLYATSGGGVAAPPPVASEMSISHLAFGILGGGV